MKKPLGTASISCECRECQQVDCVSGLGFGGSLTSIKMSLWSKTPRRIFARVMPHMMTRAPTMKPWDHASRVSFAGSDGFVCSATPVSAISTAWVMLVCPGCGRRKRRNKHPADVQSRRQSRQGFYASAGRCMQLHGSLGRTQTDPKAGDSPTLELVACPYLPNTS